MNDRPASVALVLIHDLLGSPLEFASMSQTLDARKLHHDAVEIDGYTHGRGRRALAWRSWLAAAGQSIDARYDAQAPIVLAGLGCGGALAVALAAMPRRQRVEGIAWMSPTYTGDGDAGLPALHRIATAIGADRWVRIRNDDPHGVRNEKTRKWVARELGERGLSPAGPAHVPLRAKRESAALHAHARAALADLKSPLLVLHAAGDDKTSLDRVARMTDPLGDAARLVALEHSYRMITIDNDRQRVAHELADLAGAPKRATVLPPARTPVARRPRAAVAAD